MRTSAIGACLTLPRPWASRWYLVSAIALWAGLTNVGQVSELDSSAGEPRSGEYLRVNVDGGLVYLQARDARLEDVIERIATRGDLRVIANGPIEGRLNLDLRGQPLVNALGRILRRHNFVLHQPRKSSTDGLRGRPLPLRLWIYSDQPWASSRSIVVSPSATVENRAATGHGSSAGRIETSSSIAEDNTKETIGALVSAMADANPRVRQEAVSALGEISESNILPTLQVALSDADNSVREAAIEAVLDVGGQQAARSLEVALTYQESSLRMDAVEALGEIGGETAKLLLERALNDPEESIREVASEMLAEL